MNLLIPLVIGALSAAGVYLVLRQNVLKLVVGLGLLSHATNLLILAGGWGWAQEGPAFPKEVPIIVAEEGAEHPHADAISKIHPALDEETTQAMLKKYRDPLPQALVLTAIVISFAVTAFQLVLALRIFREMGIVNIRDLRRQQG